MTEMIAYEQALQIVLEKTVAASRLEYISINSAVGRVLAEDIQSDMDLPPFDKSAMDGFALHEADTEKAPITLDVVMDIPAGSTPSGAIEPGQTASVMTGAPVPAGTESVVQVEWTSGFGGTDVNVLKPVPRGTNVSPRGEILNVGDVVLKRGTEIGVEEVSLLASVGCDPVPVFQRLNVAVLSTGDELVDPHQKPGPGQIRNSNGPALVGFFQELGQPVIRVENVPDDKQSTLDALDRALAAADCVVLSGGVSAGAYDFVEEVLEKLGVTVHTRKVAMKPGKPTVFGTLGKKMVFGLPGNPVSTMVTARVLMEPALRKRTGCRQLGPIQIAARLTHPIRKKPDRLWFVHGCLGFDAGLTVSPIKGRGSADLPAAAGGDCLIVAPKGVSQVEPDTTVQVVVWGRFVRSGGEIR